MIKRENIRLFIFLTALLFIAACTTARSTDERLVYLDYDAQQIAQLFTLTIGEDAAQQLSNSQTDILEYALSKDNRQIAYVVKEGNGGNSILGDGCGWQFASKDSELPHSNLQSPRVAS